MAIQNYNPMRDLLNFEREFDRLFNQYDRRFGIEDDRRNEELENAVWCPLADIYEDNDSFRLMMDVPGINKEDVKVSYKDHQLIISGERKQEQDAENYKFHRVERNYGKFYRSFDLPEKIDETKIQAEVDRGQLIVTIPKLEEQKEKAVNIKVK
jgi:HSP20 family protein